MILYRCDRCGKIQEKPFKNSVVITIEKEPQYHLNKSRMFCNKCAEKLMDWFVVYQEGGEQNDN